MYLSKEWHILFMETKFRQTLVFLFIEAETLIKIVVRI